MLRSERHILENHLEVLAHEKRALRARIAETESRLAEARQLYDALASHWQSIGPAAVLTDADRSVARRQRLRSFWRGMAFGAALPLSLALLSALLAFGH
jgi:hypothetical protein